MVRFGLQRIRLHQLTSEAYKYNIPVYPHRIILEHKI